MYYRTTVQHPILSGTSVTSSKINNDNTIEEEIKERIALCNKAYFANRKFLKSKSVTKRSKLKLYKTLIRPVVIYGSETWVLKEAMIQKLMVFERKIFEENIWTHKRKRRNMENQNQ
jgi:dipeptide/tripeptide permease